MTELGGTDAQCTPRDLADELGDFDIDPCSNPRSHIHAARSYQLERGEDGLAGAWEGSVWCNGPYSDPMPWCARLRAHAGPWCSLWKLDPTTKWFATLLAGGPNGEKASWAAFRKRIRFENPGNTGGAKFPCVLVWRDWAPPLAIVDRLWMTEPGSRDALGEVIGFVDRIGGYMSAEDQAIMRNAKRVHGESSR